MFFSKSLVEVEIDSTTSVMIKEVGALEMTVARSFLANSDLRDDMLTNETYACGLCLHSVRIYDENKKIVEEKIYPEVTDLKGLLERLEMPIQIWNKIFEGYVKMIVPSEENLKK